MARVVVVGGGPSGCAFAIMAARCGHDVVMYDDGRRLRSWPGESLPSGGGELAASVFGAAILDGHLRAYGTAAAWGSSDVVVHDFMGHWAGHGWILDRARFDRAAREAAAEAGVKIVAEHVGDMPEDADWVVDASGRAGAIVSRHDSVRVMCDDQVALIGVVADGGGEHVTTVETVRDGWWYTTPLPSGRRVVALVTDADLIGAERQATWAASLAETMHIRPLAGDVSAVNVGAYPSGTAYRERIAGEGWLAVGDAAVCFDPLSSQGLVTGIVMAARAATMLDGDLSTWQDDYRAVLDEHLGLRDEYLSAETRWPDSVFWSRRVRQQDP